MTAVMHHSVDERTERGRAAREQTPPSAHAGWAPARGRPDPVALLEEIMAAVRRFVKDAVRSDDVTILVLRYTG